MNIAQALIQTIWASILVLGWVKVTIAVVLITFLTRLQPLLGLVAAVLFLAYLAHWI